MDIVNYNRKAWDMQDQQDSEYKMWTQPVSEEIISQARTGNWQIVLTPHKPVPREWLPGLKNKRVLCLASGGGQQGPVLAAAGADVVVFDNSPKQLEKDQYVANRDNLNIKTELGDMRDLSRFKEEQFDIIVNPCSLQFIEEIEKVWEESYRILKYKGAILAGLIKPFLYVFDWKAWENDELTPRHKIPYSDARDLSHEELEELVISKNEPMCFGHSLESQIQGQIKAGFIIAGFYEDGAGDPGPLGKYIDYFFATRAIKPKMNSMK